MLKTEPAPVDSLENTIGRFDAFAAPSVNDRYLRIAAVHCVVFARLKCPPKAERRADHQWQTRRRSWHGDPHGLVGRTSRRSRSPASACLYAVSQGRLRTKIRR